MKKKILALLLAGAMVFSLAACTSGSGSSSDGDGSESSEGSAESPGVNECGALVSFESDNEDGVVVGF